MGSFAASANTSFLLGSNTPVPSGTANGVLYLNGSKVPTTTSDLSWNGVTFLMRRAGGDVSLNIQSTGSGTARLNLSGAGGGAAVIQSLQTGMFFNNIDAGPWVFTNSGGEQMRLNTTGLGIGTNNPARKLDVNGGIRVASANPIEWGGTTAYITGESSTNTLFFGTSGSEKMRLDAAGNLGLGTTPNTWVAPSRALQIGSVTALIDASISFGTQLAYNSYNDSIGEKYRVNGAASIYSQVSGQHRWLIAASGTAGNAISFTQAMTLDASGRLGIGVTSMSYRLDVLGGSTARLGKLLVLDDSPFITGANLSSGSNPLGIGTQTAASFTLFTNGAQRLLLDATGNVVVNTAALATNATDGFIYTPSCAGAPTGAPTAYTGRIPMVVDTTNLRVYFNIGGTWRYATLT